MTREGWYTIKQTNQTNKKQHVIYVDIFEQNTQTMSPIEGITPPKNEGVKVWH